MAQAAPCLLQSAPQIIYQYLASAMPVMTSSATSVASLDPEDTHDFADFGNRPIGVILSCVSGKETRLHLRNELLNKYETTY